MKRLVKYGSPRSLVPSLLFMLSRFAGVIFFFSSSTPGRSSTGRISPFSYQRSRLL
jgi:hypothetical protein